LLAAAGRWRGADRAPALLATVIRVAAIPEGSPPLADPAPGVVRHAWCKLPSYR
jgi:hypothetical protein